MRFGELLKTVEFEQAWEYIVSIFENVDIGECEGYRRVFQELLATKPVSRNVESEIVIEGEGYDEAIWVVEPNDPMRYDAMFSPWEDWLSFKISPELVAEHSAAKIAAFAMYAMTWWGATNKEVKKKVRKMYWSRSEVIARLTSLNRIDISKVEAYFDEDDRLVFKGDLCKRKNKLRMCAWLQKNQPKSGNPPQLNSEQSTASYWGATRQYTGILGFLGGWRQL